MFVFPGEDTGDIGFIGSISSYLTVLELSVGTEHATCNRERRAEMWGHDGSLLIR